ncbi:MAG: hypothetical protein GXO72_03045 [Caldiserica bacterium]|nr:hypothetical protein [Caldisericota bacterium]
MRPLAIIITAAALGIGAWAQGLLPELPYPGGHTLLRYEIRAPDKPPSDWILEVIPKGEAYEIRMTFVRAVPGAEGFSLLGAVMGIGLMEGDTGLLPLAPLFSLWDKAIEAGKSYLLRGRARLTTEREDEILGIPVVVGIYVHPSFPDQRALVYIPRLSHRALLFFPPYLRIEERADGGYRTLEEIELVEFKHDG